MAMLLLVEGRCEAEQFSLSAIEQLIHHVVSKRKPARHEPQPELGFAPTPEISAYSRTLRFMNIHFALALLSCRAQNCPVISLSSAGNYPIRRTVESRLAGTA